MPVQKYVAHMLHLNGFFPSWTDPVATFFSLFLYLVPCILFWLNHQNWKVITAKSYELHKAAFRAINLKATKSHSLGSRNRGFFIRRHMTQPKSVWSRNSFSRHFLEFSLRSLAVKGTWLEPAYILFEWP